MHTPANESPDGRLRVVCDLSVAAVREGAGLHEYDGTIQDLSPAGVRASLARLDASVEQDAPEDPHDAAHLQAFERALLTRLGDLEMHRRDPYVHLDNLELSCYDREYAPAGQRAQARLQHLAHWPDAVDMAVESLDMVPAPTAEALLGAARGLAAHIRPADGETGERARAAQQRFLAHLESVARDGDPDASLGPRALALLMGVPEAEHADLGRLAREADAERDRLRGMLAEACAAYDASRTPAEILPELSADHPDAGGVIAEAALQTQEAIAFTRERQLAPHLDGECRVGIAPESLRTSMAMMSWSAPEEADGPSWYWVTPPEADWAWEEAEEWLSIFSRTSLPAITVHEVAPGHFAHGRSLRRAPTAVRRILQSMTFAEGWAHYAEEMCVEEGFRSSDPRFAIGVCLEALVRVTRLAVAIGVHTGAMDVAEGTKRFMADAYMARAGAASEARRATYDPTYGRYTWGKLAIRELRERARRDWGAGYSLQRFHAALLDLGSPPLGLIATAVERG